MTANKADKPTDRNVLFILNKGSGVKGQDPSIAIEALCAQRPHISYTILVLDWQQKDGGLSRKVFHSALDIAVAVGGDGTIGLVAKYLVGTKIKLGILPTGSANGLAKNLEIPLIIADAFQLLFNGHSIAATMLAANGRPCLHLADIGFNATLIRRFEVEGRRGMWGYIKAGYKVLLHLSKLKVDLEIDSKSHRRRAVMVVIANANSYGTGVHINPIGSLTDDLFEIVVIKKISLIEIVKMMFTNWNPHPKKTEIFQCRSAIIKSSRAAHFQVDGEYYGKIKEVAVSLYKEKVHIICPKSLQA